LYPFAPHPAPGAAAAWPAYADYQAKTQRVIPVFVLEPR
jgi:hypothetical protein